eukprot:3665439-Lingulodinium_polyedra.AAC.1
MVCVRVYVRLFERDARCPRQSGDGRAMFAVRMAFARSRGSSAEKETLCGENRSSTARPMTLSLIHI